MDLINVYIQEVIRRLPEKNREDIALELRSTIEDMLPDDYSEEDVKEVLEKVGNPATLASNYSDKPRYLIGPRFYDVYISLLKMILPIATTIALISLVAEYYFGNVEETTLINIIITIFAEGISRIIEVSIQVFFWVTVVFAILERNEKLKDDQQSTKQVKNWTPDDLKNITYTPPKKAISKFEVFGGLLWTAIWATVYFNAERLLGVYNGSDDGLQFVMPALNQEVLLSFWPLVVIVIGFEIAFALYKMVQRSWSSKMAIMNAMHELVALVTFILIISNPNIFRVDFLRYMGDLFTIAPSDFASSFIWGTITVFVIASIWNVIDGFRKAKVK